MRPVRYNVAASLDGYIADPRDGFDWIPHDPGVDFAAIFARIDTVLLGRRSYELVQQMDSAPWAPETRVYVFSRSLPQGEHPDVTIVSDDSARLVDGLRREDGDGEIWLFGGGELFRGLLEAGQVDTVEVTIVPILLGGGVPLLQPGGRRARLSLSDTRTYPSGMVTLNYAVEREAA